MNFKGPFWPTIKVSLAGESSHALPGGKRDAARGEASKIESDRAHPIEPFRNAGGITVNCT